MTNSAGQYNLLIPSSGTFTIVASALGTLSSQTALTVSQNLVSTENFTLNPNPLRQSDILVTGDLGDSITRYDARTGALVGTFATPSSPYFLTLGSDGYVYGSTTTGVHRYDLYSGYDYGALTGYDASRQLAWLAPNYLWVAHDWASAYLLSVNSNPVPSSYTLLPAGGSCWGLAANPSTGDVYVTGTNNTLYYYAGADSAAVTTLALTSTEVCLCLSPDGTTLYVQGCLEVSAVAMQT